MIYLTRRERFSAAHRMFRPDPETGYFMNATRLKEIMTERVIAKLDHKNMNLETDFMAGRVATTENLAKAIWDELEYPLAEEGATLHCVRIEETENNYVEYYG